MLKNCFTLGLVTLFSSFYSFAQEPVLKAFPLSAVRLLEGPFRDAQQTDLKYILAMDADRLLAPFLREAGIPQLKPSYENWENTGLDGHIGGHYISALADMYAATGNEEVLKRLNYMLGWLRKCQLKNGNGYVGGVPGSKMLWEAVSRGDIKAGGFSLNDRWVPLYNIHKTYAGLIDAWLLTGSEMAKEILIPYADWFLGVTFNLSEDQLQDMLRSEHGGLNEVFADVAAITGDKKYLKVAERLSHRAILEPLLAQKDQLTGLHANTQIPKVIGFMRVAQLSGNKSWANASQFFWNTVVNKRSISIGGNSVREHFNAPDDFSPMLESREGPETCNSYNMLKLSRHLFLSDPSSRYMDYYERTMYNHILSSQHPEGGFVYFTPIRPRHYRVYSETHQSFWCCVGSGLENHGKYGEMIYAHDGNNLYLNLFAASALNWPEKGLKLVQQTRFPYEELSEIKLDLKKSRRFALRLRYPAWLEDGKMEVRVNGKAVPVQKDTHSYVSIDRKWKDGDQVTVSLPMHTQTEALPDKSAWVSFVHGPIVLAAATEPVTEGLKGGSSRMGHIASGPVSPLYEAPLLVSDQQDMGAQLKPVDKASLTFSIADVVWQDEFKNLKLVPFYKIHDARYMMYWPYTTREKLPEVSRAIKEKEAAKLELEALTIDVVRPGEQQPESDHNFKGGDTHAGLFKERHFRNARDWFSYDLKDREGNPAKRIRLTCYGKEKDRAFKVTVNGTALQTLKLDGSGDDDFFDIDVVLPEGLKREPGDILMLKISAESPNGTGNIYEVRLLK